MMRALSAALGVLILSGCSILFGDVDKSECRIDDDCPVGEICIDRDRCRVGVRLPDMDDIDDRDAEPGEDIGVAIDVDADSAPEPDAFVRDAAPVPVDAGPLVARYGPEGSCWDDPQGEFDDLRPTPGDLHIPQVDCSASARVWTAVSGNGPVRVWWDVDGDGDGDGSIPLDGRYAVSDRWVLVPRFDVGEGAVQVVRIDPIAGVPPEQSDPLRPSPFDQRDPVHVAGRTAFIESRPEGDTVVLVLDVEDDILALNCGNPGHDQWGVALSPGRIAWFEQPAGSRRTRLVVLDRAFCAMDAVRDERLLDGEIPRDARLLAIDDGVAWLAPDTQGSGNRIWRWRFDDAGAEPEVFEPLQASEANPVELAARGQWLAVIGYRADDTPRYVMDLVDLSTGQTRPDRSQGDARRPALSDSYAVWTSPDFDGRWRVLYERLR